MQLRICQHGAKLVDQVLSQRQCATRVICRISATFLAHDEAVVQARLPVVDKRAAALCREPMQSNLRGAGRNTMLDLGALTRGRWLRSAVFGLSPHDVCVTLVADRAFGNLAKSVDHLAPSGAIRLKRSPCSLAEDHRRVSASRRGDVDVAESADLGVNCIDLALDFREHVLGQFSERRIDGQCVRESSSGVHECRAVSLHEPNLPQSELAEGASDPRRRTREERRRMVDAM